MKPMSTTEALRDLATSQGMDFFGVADLSGAREAIVAQGGPELAAYPRALSIGKILVHDIVDRLSPEPDAVVAELYRYYCCDLVNDVLDRTALRLAGLLQTNGHRALPVPAAPRAVDSDRLCGVFSNKMAAHLAGLGWIGKSCLLVTPEVGPRARWASVLTDAPLTPTGSPMAPRCGECQACVDTCPAHAFTGEAFSPEDAREERFAAHDCHEHLRAMKEKTDHRICGLCVKACPRGQFIVGESSPLGALPPQAP